MGLINPQESQSEQDLLNPGAVKDREAAKQEEIQKALAEHLDPILKEERFDQMVYDDGMGAERTEHKHIAPARERIKQYRVRRIPPQRTGLSAITDATMPPRPSALKAAKSTTNLGAKVGLAGAGRPVTAELFDRSSVASLGIPINFKS